ncbi:hypothetical protein BD324DRAFT_627822 [Kockovaella imperatae]|uniref:Uncharacterized protein n=1 Tax=Kockovaella imperatae TaxID=4999 RepID=A0A1Y1UG05_9TREE|nr:hypothetical protein BD324DRAFT_627822 [Kockovaella imperatae]ORX36952.1 hypothetical protein BD324DRAFT_627822 [Kockovaella imperatae]
MVYVDDFGLYKPGLLLIEMVDDVIYISPLYSYYMRDRERGDRRFIFDELCSRSERT